MKNTEMMNWLIDQGLTEDLAPHAKFAVEYRDPAIKGFRSQYDVWTMKTLWNEIKNDVVFIREVEQI